MLRKFPVDACGERLWSLRDYKPRIRFLNPDAETMETRFQSPAGRNILDVLDDCLTIAFLMKTGVSLCGYRADDVDLKQIFG